MTTRTLRGFVDYFRNNDYRCCWSWVFQGDQHDVHQRPDGRHRRGALQPSQAHRPQGPNGGGHEPREADVGLHDLDGLFVYVDLQYGHYGHDGTHRGRRPLWTWTRWAWPSGLEWFRFIDKGWVNRMIQCIYDSIVIFIYFFNCTNFVDFGYLCMISNILEI